MPDSSRPSESTWSSMASTSGNTRTTPMTSACSATLRSLSRSSGTTPKFPASHRANVNLTNIHGFTAYVVMSSVAARFFTPQIGGAGAVPSFRAGEFAVPDRPRREIQPDDPPAIPAMEARTWLGFNWRYDSGLVAGAVPCYASVTRTPARSRFTATEWPRPSRMHVSGGGERLTRLTPDQEFQAGFFCDGVHATPTRPSPIPVRHRSSDPI